MVGNGFILLQATGKPNGPSSGLHEAVVGTLAGQFERKTSHGASTVARLARLPAVAAGRLPDLGAW